MHGVQTLDDAKHLLDHVTSESLKHVVVVGGGYIGLEMAEAFSYRGAKVTLLEAGSQVMRTLDPDMATLVAAALRRHGVDVRLGESAKAFEPKNASSPTKARSKPTSSSSASACGPTRASRRTPVSTSECGTP